MTNKAALICCVQTLKRLLLDEQQPHRSMIGTAIMVGEKVIKESETAVEGAEQGSATTMTPLRLAEMRLRNCYTNRQGEEVGVHIVTRDRHEHERDYPIVGTTGQLRALAERLMVAADDADEELMTRDPNRCAVCGWPLAESEKGGCVRGNCSLRPAPAKYYDPVRVEGERYGR